MHGFATQVLQTALSGLEYTASGRSLDDFLDRTGAERSAAGFILFHFFRHRKALDACILRLMKRPPERSVFHILEIAATQIFYCRGIAGESAANVAVEETRSRFGKTAAGFVNAILRKVTALPLPEEHSPEEVLPDAVLEHWKTLFPPETLEVFCRAFLTAPDAVVRYTGNGAPEEAELAALHLEPCPDAVEKSPFCFFRAAALADVLRSPGWSAGRWYVQDPATALALSLVPDFGGIRRALDICAAPGGKAMMIAERMAPGGLLVAADRSAARQKLTRENFIRRGWDFPVPAADPAELPEHWRDFDLVLADVPCSNTGVFRHRPDALWRFRPSMTEELKKLQMHLLSAAADRVAPGGLLLYSTCSIEPDENTNRCAGFLKSRPDFRSVAERGLLPDLDHDGAYAHLMRKSL